MKHLITALALAFASPVVAQDNCGLTQDVYLLLGDGGFERHSVGTRDALLIETWANYATGIWVVFATSKEGFSCILFDGTNYIREPAPNA